jgi:excisionase family DNA binding protein
MCNDKVQWISVREAAVRLRLSSSQVLRLMEIGHLQGRRAGRRWVLKRAAVDAAAKRKSARGRP